MQWLFGFCSAPQCTELVPGAAAAPGHCSSTVPCAPACQKPLLGDLDAVLSPGESSKHCLLGTEQCHSVPCPVLDGSLPEQSEQPLGMFPNLVMSYQL